MLLGIVTKLVFLLYANTNYNSRVSEANVYFRFYPGSTHAIKNAILEKSVPIYHSIYSKIFWVGCAAGTLKPLP